MTTDEDLQFVNDLQSIRNRYDLPSEMDEHLRNIIEQASDDATRGENANQTATRIQKLLTFLMEDYRDEYEEAEAVRDDLADVYATIAEQDWN